VFNLRYDPDKYKDMTPGQLAEAWRWKKDSEEADRLPVKELRYNRCPAVAPLKVLDSASEKRLRLDRKLIDKHYAALKNMKDLPGRLCAALEIMEEQRQIQLVSTEKDADNCIYDGFFGDADKQAMRVVRAAGAEELGSLNLNFKDTRLQAMLPLYKARNYPKHLTSEERAQWEKFRTRKLLGGGQSSLMSKHLQHLQEITIAGNLTTHQQYLIEELKLYAESIMPANDEM
jgi:exodeoxyribonuclease-1